ncbi:MAG: hypothetical protein ACPGWR_29805, partial [Ardenticatenaceae bacterium]
MMLPQVVNQQKFELPPNTEVVLQKMFVGYQRIVIKYDFSALGYSGSWVYRVHLLKKDATPELPVVVKIASVSLIQKEWQAYKGCAQNQWLGIAALRDKPVLLKDHDLAGLCYEFVGGDVFRLKSLHEYCLDPQVKVEDIRFVLQKRLFEMMSERIVRPSKNEFYFPLQASYDRVLPVNLLIRPEPVPEGQKPTLITPDKLPAKGLELGERVRLEGFVITKVDLRYPSVTLNLPPHQFPDTYRVRVNSFEGLKACEFHEELAPLEGVVLETRDSRFKDEIAKLNIEDLDHESVTLSDGSKLPNPFAHISSILAQTRHLKFNCIHGDLNFENILVDPDVRDIRLIDFAEAAPNHILHDFLHLEMEVITKLLPAALSEANLPPDTMYRFYQELECATFDFDHCPAHQLSHKALEKPFAILTEIRQAAHEGFYDRNDFSEYYQGLTLYLLGALRFSNLDQSPLAPLPKQVAFFGAAAIQELIKSSAGHEVEPNKPVDDASDTHKHKPALPTILRSSNPLTKVRAFGQHIGLSIYAVTLLLALFMTMYLVFGLPLNAGQD